MLVSLPWNVDSQLLKKCVSYTTPKSSIRKFPQALTFLALSLFLLDSKFSNKRLDVPLHRLCTGRTAHRESRDKALLFHDHGSREEWGFSVTPRPHFTPGKDPVPIVQEAGWASGPVWTGAENLAPPGIRSPDRPARSQSLYRLSYPAHKFSNKFEQNTENANIFSVTSNNAREVHYNIFQRIEAGLIWHCVVFTVDTSRKSYEMKLVSLNFVLILSSSSSSVGTTAHCGLWSVKQYLSVCPYLSANLSIFSLQTLEDLFPLLLSILSWVFLFVSARPVLEWRSFWASYPPPYSPGDPANLSFAPLSILLYFLLYSTLLFLDSS